LQRFTQEARTVSNLSHPNILTVYEFGQTDSASFMATEYVDGVTLREHLSRRRLKLVDVLDVAIQIVAALNAAHEAGVTHRDLKPENVMIRRDQIVKVLDFGLAKPTAKATAQQVDSKAGTKMLVQTEPGLVMGTAGYMSPEQSSGAAVDQRTDIWSVGVVLYEMIAGCLPFQGKDIHRQIIAIQEQEPAPLSHLVEGVPERLGRAVNNLLDNAAQHSDRIDVWVSADGTVAVRDHGPGIPEGDLPHLFDRFYRGATARGRPGSGLGLAIVRQVAESHGGSVHVESPEDGGARFVLSLPGSPA